MCDDSKFSFAATFLAVAADEKILIKQRLLLIAKDFSSPLPQ
jgi:hypothetical protein